jgi:hypothetical protein
MPNYPTLPEAGSGKRKIFHHPTDQFHNRPQTVYNLALAGNLFLLSLYTIQIAFHSYNIKSAWLAQSVERETLMFHSLTRRLIHLHLKVAGSTPASGFSFCVD